MRKTASHQVFGLSRCCTDPEEAEKKIRKAIGWGGSTSEEDGEENQTGKIVQERSGDW